MPVTCTYVHDGVACDAPATRAVLHTMGDRQCHIVERPAQPIESLNGAHFGPRDAPTGYVAEFCEECAEKVCAARDKRIQEKRLST